MEEIRIGVVGIGHLGSYHLQKYQKIPECRIVGVADSVPERARKAADLYGCEAVTDYRKLAGMVDAVSIAVPTGAHHEVASVFLKAGVDVLLEKPIAVTLAEADELIALADAKGLVFQIGFVERFNPAVAALHSVMGRPLFIESHRLHPFFERGTDVDVILDLMVHDLDIILHFVRSPVKTVDAVGVSVLSDKVDIANARLTFASGCVANITASRVTGKIMQKIRFFGVEGYHAVDYQKTETGLPGQEKRRRRPGDDHGKSRGDPDAGPAGRGDPRLRPGRCRPDAAAGVREGRPRCPGTGPPHQRRHRKKPGPRPVGFRHARSSACRFFSRRIACGRSDTTVSTRKVMIVAGEASGDLHGGNLVRAMHQIDPDLSFYGVGGERMQSGGGQTPRRRRRHGRGGTDGGGLQARDDPPGHASPEDLT